MQYSMEELIELVNNTDMDVLVREVYPNISGQDWNLLVNSAHAVMLSASENVDPKYLELYNDILTEENLLKLKVQHLMHAKNHTHEVKKPWYEYVPDRVKNLIEEIVNDCTEYAVHNKINVKFFHNGKVTEIKNGKVTVKNYVNIPFGEPSMNTIKFVCNDDIAEDFNEVLNDNKYKYEYISAYDGSKNHYNPYVDCWNNGQYMIGDYRVSEEEQDQFDRAISSEKKIYLHLNTTDCPDPLRYIMTIWNLLCKHTGDKGACVIGEGMEFKYCGQQYKMSPCSPYQGEGSWIPHVIVIQELLKSIGCENIEWNCGRLD